MPKTCECRLPWQRDLQVGLDLGSERGGFPGLSGQTQCSHRDLTKERRQRQGRGAGFDDGGAPS